MTFIDEKCMAIMHGGCGGPAATIVGKMALCAHHFDLLERMKTTRDVICENSLLDCGMVAVALFEGVPSCHSHAFISENYWRAAAAAERWLFELIATEAVVRDPSPENVARLKAWLKP